MRDIWMFTCRLLFIVVVLLLTYGLIHLLESVGLKQSTIAVIIFFVFFILVKLNGGRRI